MKKKLGIIAISLIGTIVIFCALLALQNKMVYPNGQITVYTSKLPIGKNTEITDKNVNHYFTTAKVDATTIIDSPVTNKSFLINKYLNNDILKGEQISEKRLSSTASRTKNIKNLREIGINFSDITEVVGGTLRAGDTIDLILTQTDQNSVKTQSELKNVLIDKAITSDGQLISRENGDKLAAAKLTLDLSAENGTKLDNAVKSGTIKAMKVLDNTTSPDITIESTKAQ